MSSPSQPTSIVLNVKGLYLNPSSFGDSAPNGALTVAKNVVIDRPSVVATRRGFNNGFGTLVNTGSNSMYQYNSVKLLHGTDHKMYYDANDLVPLSTVADYTAYTGTYIEPIPGDESSRVRGLESNKNFYFITANGTYRLDAVTNEPRLAGAPAGLSGTAATTGITGFLANNTNVAYRVVFGYRDANQQLVLGAPSSRIVVSNSSGTAANVTVTFQVPKEIQASPTSFFFQVYRGNASPNLITVPDDEMALTYEDTCTGAATQTITDITPTTLLGAALYTNQGQDGILQSNYRPPWCTDVCTFKQYAFYANTRTVHIGNITLISAGALSGADAIIPGDTITFTDSLGPTFTLTGAAANNFATGAFQVSNTGNPGLDIQVTASNIALVANAYASNTFLAAYYTSSDIDLPGRLRFDKLSLAPESFTITSSRSTCWEQSLPIVSNNETRPNRIYYSKFNQPEAVPIINYIDVGSANSPINRIVPLRDGVMVLKQDGVFRISSAAPPFTVTPIDYNIRILADNTAAELDNKVYFLSDQGVVALSDSDAQIMSFVLDKTIIENTSPTLYPNLRAVAWGISYQSDRKYVLFMPNNRLDTQSELQYVYNHLTQVWTQWTLGASCGVVFKKDGKMYLGSQAGSTPDPDDSYVYQERKTFTDRDYVDDEYTVINTTVGNVSTIVINNLALPPNLILKAGWSVAQASNSALARITDVSIGVTYTTLTLNKIQTWSLGNVIIYVPIESEIETIQFDCDNPGMNKQFTEMVYVFTEQGFSQLDVLVSSNTQGIPIADVLTPTQRGGWGVDPWGTSPWGGTLAGQGKIRRYVPQKIQRAGWLYFNISNAEAFTSFGFSGLQIFYKNTSSRQK